MEDAGCCLCGPVEGPSNLSTVEGQSAEKLPEPVAHNSWPGPLKLPVLPSPCPFPTPRLSPVSKLLLKPKPVNWAEKDEKMSFPWGEDREEGGLGWAGTPGCAPGRRPTEGSTDTEGHGAGGDRAGWGQGRGRAPAIRLHTLSP